MMKKLHESEANACGPESGCEGACWGAYYAGIGSAGRLKKYLKFEGTEKLQAKMIMKGMEEFDQKNKKALARRNGDVRTDHACMAKAVYN